jgi:hypothetical protein
MGAKSIDDFIAKMGNRCNKLVREGNILYSIKTEGYDCGWVRATKTPVSSTFSLCAKGYIKKYFEAVFQRPVKVFALFSPINGGLQNFLHGTPAAPALAPPIPPSTPPDGRVAEHIRFLHETEQFPDFLIN